MCGSFSNHSDADTQYSAKTFAHASYCYWASSLEVLEKFTKTPYNRCRVPHFFAFLSYEVREVKVKILKSEFSKELGISHGFSKWRGVVYVWYTNKNMHLLNSI